MNDSEIVVCSRCGKTHEYGFGGYYYNPHNNFKPECNSHKVIKGEPLVADNDMSISKAVQTLVNESRTVKMTREALIALNFLSDHVSDIEDIAEVYIEEIEGGALAAWEDCRDEGMDDDDLGEQRLFDHEEMVYIACHAILGREVEWPEGYMPEATEAAQ